MRYLGVIASAPGTKISEPSSSCELRTLALGLRIKVCVCALTGWTISVGGCARGGGRFTSHASITL